MKTAVMGIVLALLSAAPIQLSGCATRHTTTTERVPGDATVIETHKETVAVESDGGILSGIFEVLGDIIALPFRIIGALFDALF